MMRSSVRLAVSMAGFVAVAALANAQPVGPRNPNITPVLGSPVRSPATTTEYSVTSVFAAAFTGFGALDPIATNGFYRALRACGLPTGKSGYCLYDTKKTATGLLLDAGLSDAEAMDFSGHRTASMLHRYRAKTAARHGASVRKRDEYLEKLGAASQT